MLNSTIHKVAQVAKGDPIDEDVQENESQMDKIHLEEAQSQEGHSEGIEEQHVDSSKLLDSDSFDSSIPEYNGNFQLLYSDDEMVDLMDGNFPKFNDTDYSISIPGEFFVRQRHWVADKVDNNISSDIIMPSSTQESAKASDKLGN